MARPRRRLPVLQTSTEAQDEPRPAWQWALFGAVTILLGWLVLAAVVGRAASALLDRWPGLGTLAVAAQLVAYAVACAAGGYVVTRFGQVKSAAASTASGVTVGLVGSTLAIAQAGRSIAPIGWILVVSLLVGLGAAAAGFGGRLGLRSR